MPALAPASINASPNALRCPACRWVWDSVAPPVAVQGMQPVQHHCPNRKCTRRHWFVVYRLSLTPPARVRVVSIVPRLGSDAGSIRDSLRLVPGMNEDLIEWAVFVATNAPELEVAVA